ncbi:MAG: NifB/NifX family molybdenum-iron cluster-binding protein [candidate division Zixibacteria bacterium]|nr:NifB/NifX family molybdenum-iron cluster-binding protein [candidate division Zixibacteria bacterium]
MRIAVASDGKELSSKVDPRFGRARYIVIHDTGKSELEVLDNQEASQLSGGAGVKAAETVVDKKVDYVISQNFGPNALKVFKTANVKAAVFSDGTVAEAIELVKRNQLNII